MKITVKFSAVDGFRQSRSFKTLTGAQQYAQKWVGKTPEVSKTFQYAVSPDGVSKVTCCGCSVTDLFPFLKEKTNETLWSDVD